MAPSLGYYIAKGGRNLMKMPMKIEMEMFAPCGMNCMVCYKHCYTKKTRQPCGGCMVESKGKPEHCRKCKIKDCVQSKGIAHLMVTHIQKYACTECGGIISLHDKVCTECGKKID